MTQVVERGRKSRIGLGGDPKGGTSQLKLRLFVPNESQIDDGLDVFLILALDAAGHALGAAEVILADEHVNDGILKAEVFGVFEGFVLKEGHRLGGAVLAEVDPREIDGGFVEIGFDFEGFFVGDDACSEVAQTVLEHADVVPGFVRAAVFLGEGLVALECNRRLVISDFAGLFEGAIRVAVFLFVLSTLKDGVAAGRGGGGVGVPATLFAALFAALAALFAALLAALAVLLIAVLVVLLAVFAAVLTVFLAAVVAVFAVVLVVFFAVLVVASQPRSQTSEKSGRSVWQNDRNLCFIVFPSVGWEAF